MNASKENAREALKRLDDVPDVGDVFTFIRGFLEAATRKLPTEETFAKDKARNRREKDVSPAMTADYNDAGH